MVWDYSAISVAWYPNFDDSLERMAGIAETMVGDGQKMRITGNQAHLTPPQPALPVFYPSHIPIPNSRLHEKGQ